MKFRIVCHTCRVQDKERFFEKEEFNGMAYPLILNHYHLDEGHAYHEKDIYVEVDVQDKRGFIFKCVKGHVFFGSLQLEFYELLYDRGIFAFDDTYYRETVANLAASIERFHEYCIKVMLQAGGIEHSQIEKSWNLIKKQSERQYGAFLFLYLNFFKTPPPKIEPIRKNQDWTSFRNNVIHAGYFPSKEETERAIQVTTRYIKQIKHYFSDEVNSRKIIEYRLEQDRKIFDALVEEYLEGGGLDLNDVDRSDIRIIPFLNVRRNMFSGHEYDESSIFDESLSLEEKIKLFKEINMTAYRF